MAEVTAMANTGIGGTEPQGAARMANDRIGWESRYDKGAGALGAKQASRIPGK
jgi:hypothetical protein